MTLLGLTRKIQSGLLSGVVTSALLFSLGNLQPNYQQQSALLLYQLLNGRDASLASLSDPTAPFRPSAPSIAIICLWSVSLFTAIAAGFGAMLCKQWRAEYNSGTDPAVDLLRACRRQARFMTFQGWNIHATVLLPPLLLFSVFLFFVGSFIFVWQLNTVIATVYTFTGAIFFILYTTFLPVVTKTPFRPYSVLLAHRLSVVAGKVSIPVVDRIAQGCFIALRYMTDAVVDGLARISPGKGNWSEKARSIFPRKYQHMRVWWENWFDDSLDQIDISPQVQEEAILWLSQMHLTDLSETEAVVSSLALISPSRPHKFPKSVVVFLNSALESSCRGTLSPARIDSVLALGRIKYQSVIDHNWDQDHTVRGMPVTALVAYAAQQLTISAFEGDFSTPQPEGIRERLLAAAAWLSPVDTVEKVTPEGERLTIQDRREFVRQIEITLMQHIRGEKRLDNGVLIDLIHGMHASIPRGSYGTRTSIIPFPPFTCEDHSSPWSEDESVIRALITYALDLLSYTKRKRRLVEREVGSGELALDLIDTLCGSAALTALATPATLAAPPTPSVSPEVALFGLWLIHRSPYAFRARKTILADIIHTWNLTKEAIPEDHRNRKRLNFYAIDAFVAVARCHLIAEGELPKFRADDVLSLLKASLEDRHSRPVVAYALALILNLGTSKQATTLSTIDVGSFADIFRTVRSDLEANTTDEDVLNLYIHTALLLFRSEQPPVDIERVKALVEEMEKKIREVVVGLDPVSAKDSEDEMNVGTNRVRWKAIYLSGLLVRFLPPDEREERIKEIRTSVETTVQKGELPLAKDYKRCLKPLYEGQKKLQRPAERKGKSFTAFEAWIDDFPLFPSAGSVLSPT